MSSTKLPEKSFRAGAINVAVWKNQTVTKDGQVREYKTVSMERGYQDPSGEWKSTSSLRTSDLPKATMVLSKAFEYLTMSDEAVAGECAK